MVMFDTTLQEAWSTLLSSFASQFNAHAMQIRSQLATVKKLDSSAATYFNTVKSLSDTLTSIGKPLRPEEFTSYVLDGLDEEYDALIEMVLGHDDPMSVRDLYARLLSTEQGIESRRAAEFNSTSHSANAAAPPGARAPRSGAPAPITQLLRL